MLSQVMNALSFAALGLSALSSAAAVDPAPGTSVRLNWKCESLTLPAPGTGNQGGSSGSGYFDSNLQMTNPDGSVTYSQYCTKIACTGTCYEYCRFDSPFLPAGPLEYVNVNFSPAGGGCSMNFEYNGKSYNTDDGSPDGDCGLDNGGFEPFGSTQSAECYIA